MTTASLEIRRRDAQRTQSFFREINNRVAELSQDRDVSPPRFICECPSVDCGATIVLSLEEYTQVRADSACFIVLDGHEDAEIQDVLERRGDCVVVRKTASKPARRTRANTRPIESRMSP